MKKLIFFYLLSVVLFSCQNNKSKDTYLLSDEKKISKALVEVNHSIVKRNRDHINNFVRRTGWDLKECEEGIWFGKIVESEEKSDSVKLNDLLYYSWTLRLIDGSYPYDLAREAKSSVLNVGNGGVESGLEKALLMMNEGDSARVIIPPYLAHGNFGDMERIPPGAILIFDIKLSKISRP